MLTANCFNKLTYEETKNFGFVRGGYANVGGKGGMFHKLRGSCGGDLLPKIKCNTEKVIIEEDEVIIGDFRPFFIDYIAPTKAIKAIQQYINKCHKWHAKRNKKMKRLIDAGKDSTQKYKKYLRWHPAPKFHLNERHCKPCKMSPTYLDGLIVEKVDKSPLAENTIYRDVFWGYTINICCRTYYKVKTADFYIMYEDYSTFSIDYDYNYCPLKELTPSIITDHFEKRDYLSTKRALASYLAYCETEVIRCHTEKSKRALALQQKLKALKD